ncbi:hypothetical protein GCM10010430_80570 [Kitasatospora cystarginea]|uniref:Secreted protein n=1 Tax=Kitasatospora cystarginea TaxID=58350 RepID=A0ABP5RZA2_9ACTN
MRGTVVLQGVRVLDGQVTQPLLVVLGGVAALMHERGDQAIGPLHGLAGTVDELLLHPRPVPRVALSGVGCQRLDLQLLVALLAAA